MQAINPKNVLFIKLGGGGIFEQSCIEKNHNLRLGYEDVDHQLCIDGKWDEVRKYFIQKLRVKPFVATSHTNQIRQFYEEGADTLWITFYANKMYWCLSDPKIFLESDGTKTRPVIGRWSDSDIFGKALTSDRLRGGLLKTQGFRGTICSVGEHKYAVGKINGKISPDIIAVEESLNDLKSKVSILIQQLQWKDFETLVDLIFREAGWQKVGVTGKTQKTLDLDLLAPVTGDRAIVQIKSQSNLDEFENYQDQFAKMTDYDCFFFVVHTPSDDLKNFKNEFEVKLMLLDEVARLTIASGLTNWVMDKTS